VGFLGGSATVLAAAAIAAGTSPPGGGDTLKMTTMPEHAAVDPGQTATFRVTILGRALTNVHVTGRLTAPESMTLTIPPGQSPWRCTGTATTFDCRRARVDGPAGLAVAVRTVRRRFLSELTLATRASADQGSTAAADSTVTLRGAPGSVAAVFNRVEGTGPHPPATWSRMVFPITVNRAPDASGFFFARQWIFSGPEGITAVAGIQPRPGGRMGLRFSVFGEGTAPAAETCKAGTDGGVGTTCALETLPLVWGHRYEFVVARDTSVNAPGRSLWRGWVRDTGARTPLVRRIGAWSLPVADTGIEGSVDGFIEHYAGVMECRQLPFADVTFGAPRVDAPATVSALGRPTGYCASKIPYTSTIRNGDQRVTVGTR
jgi:hypothetical protein